MLGGIVVTALHRRGLFSAFCLLPPPSIPRPHSSNYQRKCLFLCDHSEQLKRSKKKKRQHVGQHCLTLGRHDKAGVCRLIWLARRHSHSVVSLAGILCVVVLFTFFVTNSKGFCWLLCATMAAPLSVTCSFLINFYELHNGRFVLRIDHVSLGNMGQ